VDGHRPRANGTFSSRNRYDDARVNCSSRVLASCPQIRANAAGARPIQSDLVAGNRILADRGIVRRLRNISVRHPANKNISVSRSLAQSGDAADITGEYDLERGCSRSEGPDFVQGALHPQRDLSRAARRERRVHCHAVAIPVGVTKVPMRAMYHQSAFWRGRPVFEIREAAGA